MYKFKMIIISVSILCLIYLNGCGNISKDTQFDNENYISDEQDSFVSEDEETIDEMLLKLTKKDELDGLSQQELVIIFEMKEYLYRSFQIPYDVYRQAYEENFANNQNPDNKILIGYTNVVIEDATTEDYEKLKGYNFIGLTLEETKKKIMETGYDLEKQELIINSSGKNGHILCISEPVPGYDDNESYVYVIKKLVLKDEGNSSEYTMHSLIKYNFKHIDGEFKISSRLHKDSFPSPTLNVLTEGTSDPTLSKMVNEFKVRNNLDILNFSIEFDIRKFFEKYTNY